MAKSHSSSHQNRPEKLELGFGGTSEVPAGLLDIMRSNSAAWEEMMRNKCAATNKVPGSDSSQPTQDRCSQRKDANPDER
jgi:hypothetical protein